MRLLSKLPNENEKVIAKDCTLGQAFTMIDSWCYDNNAECDWNGSYKYEWDDEFHIYCYDKDDEEFVNEFTITDV